jgi:hypothetical protein
VRLATILVLATCVAASPARADDAEDAAFARLPSPQLGVNLAALPIPFPVPAADAALGPGVEVGIGLGRFKLVAEAAVAFADARTGATSHAGGWVGRAGGALRWLAREYQPLDVVTSDFYLVAAAGETRAWWRDGARTSRPDISVGFGEALRATNRYRFGMRVEMRVEFGLGDDAPAVACRGSCMTVASSSGLFALVGATW